MMQEGMANAIPNVSTGVVSSVVPSPPTDYWPVKPGSNNSF